MPNLLSLRQLIGYRVMDPAGPTELIVSDLEINKEKRIVSLVLREPRDRSPHYATDWLDVKVDHRKRKVFIIPALLRRFNPPNAN
ncbi:MAG: hypothetical protein AAFU03_18245 [Bacteroidota bacterium]